MTDYEIDSLWMRRTNIHNGELMPQLRDFARAVIKESVAKERVRVMLAIADEWCGYDDMAETLRERARGAA